MEDLAKYVILLLFCATASEAVIEFLVTPILDVLLPKDVPKNVGIRTVVFNFLSAALGVGIALGFRLGMFQVLGGVAIYPAIDQALTGVLLGRGSNWMHTIIQTFLLKQEALKADIAETKAFTEKREPLILPT